MTKKADRQPQARPTYTYPWFHKSVVEELGGTVPSVWYCQKSKGRQVENEYSTNIMGKFRCTKDTCSKPGWNSKVVAITIRGYAEHGYNAVVFGQKCEMCHEMGALTVNKQSYVERVAYRIKRWAGVETEIQPYTLKKGPPHKSDLCEGCKKGVCRQRSEDD